MNKRKIAGIGITGLVGSRVVELLSDTYEFQNYSTQNGFDITKPETLHTFRNSDADIVLHFAAKADVDGCELDKPFGKDGPAWQINVEGTRNIAKLCHETRKKMLYVSTDFVFSGENTPDGGYSESDSPDPINWYAVTKYEGEKVVQDVLQDWIIVRPAYPYRAKFDAKKDFVRAIIDRLRSGQSVAAITDHYMTPTFIDDFAIALAALLQSDISGIYHVVGSESVTPYDASMLIANTFGLDAGHISRTTREEYFSGKAQRPFNVSLKNDKIRKLGIEMKTFREGLEVLKKQL
jgi:dTDP-4-dehydrorhamnose reductase